MYNTVAMTTVGVLYNEYESILLEAKEMKTLRSFH